MNPTIVDAARSAAGQYNVPLANLLAVIEVESAGIVFAKVRGPEGAFQVEPLIRWEGHYFDKRLSGAAQRVARGKGLADPKAGAVKNPKDQQARWDNLLLPALTIARDAAIESTSWGLGQVMGAHWKRLGFANAQELLVCARSGVAGQIDLMLRYCVAFGLIDELQRGDFAGFARAYNGPAYRANRYDTRMTAAAREFAKYNEGMSSTQVTRATKAAGMVRQGTEGAKVREVQALLTRAGLSVTVDGDFGPSTKQAVEHFQAHYGLAKDGMVGPETAAALEAFKADPGETPGVPGPAMAFVATPQGRQGALSIGGALAIETAKESVQRALDTISPMLGVSGLVDWIYTALTAGSAALAIGGVAWVAYGWFRANTTRGVAA